MTQMRFTEEDFNTFTIEGLDARMEVLKETVVEAYSSRRTFCPNFISFNRR